MKQLDREMFTAYARKRAQLGAPLIVDRLASKETNDIIEKVNAEEKEKKDG